MSNNYPFHKLERMERSKDLIMSQLRKLTQSVYYSGFVIECPNAGIQIGGAGGTCYGAHQIALPSKPIDDIYCKRIQIGEGTINIDGDDIRFGDVGPIITSDKIDTVIIKNNLNVLGDMEVEGDVKIDGTIDVEGDIVFEGNVDICGNLTIDGTLDVSGNATFYNNVDICGNMYIGKDLFVSGKIFASAIEASGYFVQDNVEISGNLTVNGDTFLKQDLYVYNNVDICGNLTVDGTLDVSGDATFYNNVDICGNLTVDGTLDVSGNATFYNNVDICGNLTVDGTLDVSGDATFYNNVDICGNLTVNGEKITNIYNNRIEVSTSTSLSEGINLVATVNNTSSLTITLPSITKINQFLIVNESGNASTFPITILPPGGVLISGNTSFILNTNYSCVYLYSVPSSNAYFISSTLP